MNILIMMPLDEAQVFEQAWLQRRFNKLENTTSIAYSVFAEYLLEVNKVKNWTEAIIYTYPSILRFAEIAAKEKKDVVYLGNAPQDIEMDTIIGFDLTKEGKISNKLVEKLKEYYEKEEVIYNKINNFYSVENCETVFNDKELLLEFVKKILDK